MLTRVAALLPVLLAPFASLAQGALPAIQAASAAPETNPYGLAALWAQGDIVSRATLVILAIMSLASWYVLVAKLLAQRRMGGQGRVANASFWRADTVRELSLIHI